ncbi:MAG: FecR family protein [Chloroflexota bacterium]|nr:FecR family protein [Chloroflexota bacterium]
MSRNPERLAWFILVVSFSTCCLIAIGAPLLGRWYLDRVLSPQLPSLTAINGTTSVNKQGAEDATAVTSTMEEVPEGSWIFTHDSQALLKFFDQSNVTLYRDTEIALLQSQSPRFSLSSKPSRIRLLMQRGRVRLDVAAEGSRALDFRVRTPYSRVSLKEGSYIVEVRGSESQAICRYGEARITAGDEVVELKRRERVIAREEGFSRLLSAMRNLIRNGDFQKPLTVGWKSYNIQSNPAEVEGQASLIALNDGRRAVLLSRRGVAENHAETGIKQRINCDVRDATSLRLHLSVRLAYQSLPGGGYRSSEFPVIVRLDYKDAYDNDRFVTHGFYYVDPIQDWPIINGEKIPALVWFPYASGNLLNWPQLLEAPPATVTSISIYASGWEYDSMVTEVELLVEE